MKRIMWAVLIGVVWAGSAQADYLEVRREADLKDVPRGNPLGQKLQPDTFLDLLDEDGPVDGWYEAEPFDGSLPSGFIFRNFVRRFSGDIPDHLVSPVRLTSTCPAMADPTFGVTQFACSAADRHLAIGKPQAVHHRAREGYALAHDARLKIPLWVQYHLTREDLGGAVDRTNDFRPDTSLPPVARSTPSDYVGSGFDQGHMAPAEAMARNERTMSESFYMSNMSPQIGVGFNQQIWANLEAGVRGWVQQRGPLTVITGPIFEVEEGQVSYRTIGESRVAVPNAFFKIVVDVNDPDDPDAIAFILRNEDLRGESLTNFLRSIDEIESKTGLDFLSGLPDEVQEQVETERATELW